MIPKSFNVNNGHDTMGCPGPGHIDGLNMIQEDNCIYNDKLSIHVQRLAVPI